MILHSLVTVTIHFSLTSFPFVLISLYKIQHRSWKLIANKVSIA